MFKKFILGLFVIVTVNGDIDFLKFDIYENCEGKDAGNYTLVAHVTRDDQCTLQSTKNVGGVNLIQSIKHGQNAVNSLQTLALSQYPAGAFHQMEALYLVTDGPLQGKYIYRKLILLEQAYLKKCSSVLGYSFVTSKSSSLLISNKLDLNVVLSPTGGYDEFKKGCTTQCYGTTYSV